MLLIFSLYPYLDIAIFFVFLSPTTVFVQIFIIIFLFEELLEILGFIDGWWKIGERVTEVERVTTIMKDQFTDEKGQHLIFVVLSLLDLHDIIQLGL